VDSNTRKVLDTSQLSSDRQHYNLDVAGSQEFKNFYTHEQSPKGMTVLDKNTINQASFITGLPEYQVRAERSPLTFTRSKLN
jgi:hypothetical protein